MYTGITQGLYKIIRLHQEPGLLTYTVQLSPLLVQGLKAGDSVAVDGVCQTVVEVDKDAVTFQAMQETLDKTTLQRLALGDLVSIERSLRWGDEIGGHAVSGHVFGMGWVHQRMQTQHNLTLVIQCPTTWMKYILPKGFIAVDGSSLTVGETIPLQGLFYLHFIPETLRLTQFATKQVQDRVNIELDAQTKTIVDTVERVLASKDAL